MGRRKRRIAEHLETDEERAERLSQRTAKGHDKRSELGFVHPAVKRALGIDLDDNLYTMTTAQKYASIAYASLSLRRRQRLLPAFLDALDDGKPVTLVKALIRNELPAGSLDRIAKQVADHKRDEPAEAEIARKRAKARREKRAAEKQSVS